MTVFTKKYLQPNFIFQHMFIPSALVLFYSGSFAILSRFIFPSTIDANVNYFFSLDLIACSLLILLLVSLALASLRVKAPRPVFVSPPRTRRLIDILWIVLLPLVPVTRYLLANQDIVPLLDMYITLTVCLIVSLIMVIAIPMFLGKYSPVRLLVSTASAFVFTIINMASISGSLHWYADRRTSSIQLVLFALALGGTWLLLGLENKKDKVLIVVVIAGVIVTPALRQNTAGDPPDTYEENPPDTQENHLAELVAGRQPISTPNIYLMVYDSYVPNETMLNHGIDNSVQESFLIEQGFTLYPTTYSVGHHTLLSMNRVFNVSWEHYGHLRMGVDGSGVVHGLLQSLGYWNVGIFHNDYMFRNSTSQYDYYTTRNMPSLLSSQLLLAGIGMGEFRFDIDQLGTHIGDKSFLLDKSEVLAAPSEAPLFVYTHSYSPGHSQDSGVCRPNEAELFSERLDRANVTMRQDIDAIMTNDPDAIIIIAGDHGPALTKNCAELDGYDPAEITREDIQDRYGTFLGVRWPAEDYNEYDQITVLQDIFPAIFAWMYRDPALLESKIEPVTINSGVVVRDGVIFGGKDDGQPLFLSGE